MLKVKDADYARPPRPPLSRQDLYARMIRVQNGLADVRKMLGFAIIAFVLQVTALLILIFALIGAS